MPTVAVITMVPADTPVIWLVAVLATGSDDVHVDSAETSAVVASSNVPTAMNDAISPA
jgi:hypothetical protein